MSHFDWFYVMNAVSVVAMYSSQCPRSHTPLVRFVFEKRFTKEPFRSETRETNILRTSRETSRFVNVSAPRGFQGHLKVSIPEIMLRLGSGYDHRPVPS